MYYVICNDKLFYISQDVTGRFSVTTSFNDAKKWPKVSKATNVCKEVNRSFRGYNFKVKGISQEEDASIHNGDFVTCQAQQERQQTDNVSKRMAVPQTELDYDVLKVVDDFCALFKQAEERRPYIREKIRELEMEIVDIEHAAEFYTLNAAQGYRLYKLLHDVRVERRELKNQLDRIDILLDTPVNVVDMENLRKSIVGIDHRQYTPRINNELFGV